MMKSQILILLLYSASVTASVQAGTVDRLLDKYTANGAGSYSAQAGEELWNSSVIAPDGQQRSCASCHGSRLDQPGKHVSIGKQIDPMSPAINSQRLTDEKKIEKWFKRNCKWTFARECSAQEKGHVLLYLQQQ